MPDALFQELQKLLSPPQHTWNYTPIFSILAKGYNRDPKRYNAEWRRYLSTFEWPSLTVCSNDELVQMAALLPTRFKLRMLQSDDFHEYEPYGDQGLQKLAQLVCVSTLDELYLPSQCVGDAGLIALTESPFVLNIKVLDLGSNGITDAGVARLVNSPAMRAVQRLFLEENPLSNASAVAIAESRFASQLTTLSLDDCGIDESMSNVLRRAHPQLEVLYLQT